MKRLKTPTGSTLDNISQMGDTADSCKRKALLVHEGSFQSSDGPIEFDAERIKLVIESHNAKIMALAETYGGLDKMPIGAFPPVLDQHNSESNDQVIGRLNCLLMLEVRDVPGVGKNLACALGEPTFLGAETCKKVMDGRIYHLSIGIDEETNTLSELSAVIDPAAPGAMLLSKGKKLKGDTMSLKKRLSAHKDRLTKLNSLKSEVDDVTKKLAATKTKLVHTQAEGKITARLSKLVKEGKMTPAEFKNFDADKIKKLAALDEDSRETVLGALEALEPKVDPKQHGTSEGLNVSQIRKGLEKKQEKKLKAEIKGDLKRLGVKMADEEDDKEKEMSVPDPDFKEKAQMGSEYMKEMKAALEKGDVEMAKGCLAKMEAGYASEGTKTAEMSIPDVSSENQEKSMAEMQQQVDQLNTQLARLASMVGEIMKVEEEEGHDLEAEEKKMKAEVEGDAGKDGQQ